MLASATIGGEVGLYDRCTVRRPTSRARQRESLRRDRVGGDDAATLVQSRTGTRADIELAIENVLEAGYRTPDIAQGTGGYVVSTSDFGEVICQAVTEIADMRHAYHAV
jgi:3-isopropylmalate dehydrogenase